MAAANQPTWSWRPNGSPRAPHHSAIVRTGPNTPAPTYIYLTLGRILKSPLLPGPRREPPPLSSSPVLSSPVLSSPGLASPGRSAPVLLSPVLLSPVLLSPLLWPAFCAGGPFGNSVFALSIASCSAAPPSLVPSTLTSVVPPLLQVTVHFDMLPETNPWNVAETGCGPAIFASYHL